MNCHETYPLLHAYLDGELDLVRSLDLEQHLKTCAACASHRRSLQSLRSALRNADLAFRAPDSLRARLRQNIHETSTEKTSRNRSSWLWQWLTFGALGFAALTLILRPIGVSPSDQLAEAAISDHVRSLMPGHLTDVISSDQHTVKPWFNGKIDFAPDVNDFAAQGFPLIGGRLDYLNGRTVAALVYKRNQHTINVFVWPAKTSAADEIKNRRGYTVINRDLNGLHYCIVSDLNAKELADFANLLGK